MKKSRPITVIENIIFVSMTDDVYDTSAYNYNHISRAKAREIS